MHSFADLHVQDGDAKKFAAVFGNCFPMTRLGGAIFFENFRSLGAHWFDSVHAPVKENTALYEQFSSEVISKKNSLKSVMVSGTHCP